jgi:NAD-dependent dihydropyrimidine dehydrogenase PreA subunit
MNRNDDLYRRLQQHFDNAPIPFPASQSGVELRILKHLFTRKEAEIALALNVIPEPLKKIHRRLKVLQISSEELRKILDAMIMKGLINEGIAKYKSKPVVAYGKVPLVVGMFELQVNRLTRSVVEDFHAYIDETFGDAIFKQKTPQLRTVPINTQVAFTGTIGRYDDIRSFIGETKGPFGVMNCICRQAQELLGHSCSNTENHETCLSVGPAARWLRKLGHARLISRAEFQERLDRAEAQGLVLQPQNSQSPQYICCCCPDCCELLINVRKFPRPIDYYNPNYQARGNPEDCTGCKTCEKRCPMNAVTVIDKKAQIYLNRCIGCGVCAVACKVNAIKLLPRERQTVPPRNTQALYQKIMMERYGPLRTLGKAAKLLMGGKL